LAYNTSLVLGSTFPLNLFLSLFPLEIPCLSILSFCLFPLNYILLVLFIILLAVGLSIPIVLCEFLFCYIIACYNKSSQLLLISPHLQVVSNKQLVSMERYRHHLECFKSTIEYVFLICLHAYLLIMNTKLIHIFTVMSKIKLVKLSDLVWQYHGTPKLHDLTYMLVIFCGKNLISSQIQIDIFFGILKAFDHYSKNKKSFMLSRVFHPCEFNTFIIIMG
jgi:hypothetical protein